MPLYDALAADKTDDTASDDDHPDHHNDLAAALNLIRTAIGEGRNVASGIPGLDVEGKLPTSTIPAVALVAVTEVASQAAMLALTAQAGDVAVRSDQAKTYMLGGSGDPTVLANWIWLQTPSDVVLSVNGQAGVVNLSAANVGADPAGSAASAQAAAIAAAAAALTAAKVPVMLHAEGLSAGDITLATSATRVMAAAYNMPGGSVDADDFVEIEAWGPLTQNSGAGKTITVNLKIGATTLTMACTAVPASATAHGWRVLATGRITSNVLHHWTATLHIANTTPATAYAASTVDIGSATAIDLEMATNNATATQNTRLAGMKIRRIVV